MATFDAPLIEVVDDASEHSNSCEDSVLTPRRELYYSECTSLLNDTGESANDKHHGCFIHLKSKFQGQTYLKSKLLNLILIWVFLASELYWIFTDPNSVITPLTS